MRFTPVVLAALPALTLAHSEGHALLPKLVGGRKMLSDLRSRGLLNSEIEALTNVASHAHEVREVKAEQKEKKVLDSRDNTDGQCGVGVEGTPSCAEGYCCSPAGWCGKTEDYCAAPDCQFRYGSGCDTNRVPAGESTANVARPKMGSVLYGGAGIYDCVVPGDVAFTFDDGPYLYTSDLLDKLAAYNASATFMITGNNLGKGGIDNTSTPYPGIIKRMVAEGHQIASHTWGHQNLTDLSPQEFENQIVYNEMAFNGILGYWPTYMRPPYSECNDTCGSILADMGYHVTYFDVDTEGYLNDSPTLIQNSKNIWTSSLSALNPATDNILEIEHDIHYQTVYNLTDYILSTMYSAGFKSVTVGECLGDPKENWYRNASSVATKTLTTTTDATCGGTNGWTCMGGQWGNCCSVNGWCGSSDAYCGTGCQSAFGTCN